MSQSGHNASIGGACNTDSYNIDASSEPQGQRCGDVIHHFAGRRGRYMADEAKGANKYSVHILKADKSYEVNVDSSGKVLEITQGVQSNDESKLQKDSPKISLEDAERVALGRVSGTIIESGLDHFNNRLVYDIR